MSCIGKHSWAFVPVTKKLKLSLQLEWLRTAIGVTSVVGTYKMNWGAMCLKPSAYTIMIYRVSQEEWTKLRESVPYVELYRYNPKHLYPNLNGYGDNGHRKVWASGVSTYCTPSVTPLRMPGNQTPLANVAMQWPWRDYASAAACVKCLVTLRTNMTWVWVFLYFNLVALCHSQVSLMLSTDISITETTYSCQF